MQTATSTVESTLPVSAAGRRTAPWVGVLGVATIASWLAVVGGSELLRRGTLLATVQRDRAVMVAPALLLVVGLVLVAEWRWPAVPRRGVPRSLLVDAGYLALFAVALTPVLTVVQAGFTWEIDHHASFLAVGRLSWVPRLAVVVAVVVGMDALNWAVHVANHRLPSWWRLHALHHSQEEMSVLTTFRTHPLVHATYLPALLPALVLRGAGAAPSWAIVAYGCAVALAHANLPWGFGPLGKVLVSPAYHRLHHARTFPEGTPGTNFGFLLVCWDQLAGLARYPAGGPAPATGLSGRPVPIEQDTRRSLGRVVAGQLAQPFRRDSALEGWWRP
ncbi:MAG TPA: sterol desaturase family protein [Acidimicrobiales bacterium]|nr:sterol desaturase family protein [Acidimicrobiales bacterium]